MSDTITAAQKKANLAKNIVAREHEVYGYQVNIDNYTALIALLPSEWPVELAQYQNLTPDQIVDQVPEVDIQEVSDLLFRAKILKLLKTETIEQGKAKHIYDALVSQIDPSELDALLATAAAAQ